MAYEKPVLKISFCFNPLKMKDFLSAFEMLKIIKTKAETKYSYEKLNSEALQLYRRTFPVGVNVALDNFTFESLKFQASEHSKFFKKQKSGASLEQYLSKAMNRDLQKYFQELAKVQDSIAIFHKTLNPKTNNLLTAPCKFSEAVPKIWFEVVKLIDGSLSMMCWVNIEDKEVELSHFNRNNFLLEYGNVYYFLSAADAQILDWLQEVKPERYGNNPAHFTSHIIKHLELKYLVKKDGIFEKKVIEVEPVNCILLSEINSGSFLMLTPQWKYEDVLLEGEFKEEHEMSIGGELYCIKRSKEKEQQFVNSIKELHPNFAKQFNGYFYLPFDEAKKKNWFLKTYHKLLEENVELIGMDMLRHFRYSQYPVKTDLSNIKTTDFLIEADIEISFGDEKVNPNEIQKILYNNQKNILLKDNSIGVLDDEWITNYSAVIKHSKIEKGRISFPQWLLMKAREIAQLQELKLVIDGD